MANTAPTKVVSHEGAKQNDFLILSDSLERLRDLSNQVRLNELQQDKEYMQLCERMSEIARLAHTCNGIYFNLFMQDRNLLQRSEEERTYTNGPK